MRRARRRFARKEWLSEAMEWNGDAIVYDPVERRNVPVDQYQREIAYPMMAAFDRLPLWERTAVAASADGYF